MPNLSKSSASRSKAAPANAPGIEQLARYQHQRVGIFIDVQNLYHSAKHLHHGKVSYRELLRALTSDRQLIRALAYVVKSDGVADRSDRTDRASTGVKRPNNPPTPAVSTPSDEPTAEASFFEALEDAGLELRLKDLQIFGDGSKKADWDVGMAVDAIRMAPFLDVVILVTGDGDFVPLVDYLKWGLGRFVEVAAFRGSVSSKLHEVADRFIGIESLPRVIMKR